MCIAHFSFFFYNLDILKNIDQVSNRVIVTNTLAAETGSIKDNIFMDEVKKSLEDNSDKLHLFHI